MSIEFSIGYPREARINEEESSGMVKFPHTLKVTRNNNTDEVIILFNCSFKIKGWKRLLKYKVINQLYQSQVMSLMNFTRL